MVLLVILRVVKVVRGSCWGIWRLLGLIKLFKQAQKERAKVGILLDRFRILTLTTNDFLQSLFWCIFWNINLKGKLGFFDEIIKISSLFRHAFDILNQLILDFIVTLLCHVMSIFD